MSIEILLVTAAFFAAMLGFAFIARMIFIKKRSVFDDTVFNFLENHVSNKNTDIMEVFSFLGSHTFLIPANIFIAGYFLLRNKRWTSIKVPVISLSGLLLMFLLKEFFHRDRPLDPLVHAAKGHSFPSGHALMSVTFYGLLVYLAWIKWKQSNVRWWVVLAIITLVVFIGISRIYLRVHYASDVCAGFAVGLIWLVLALSIVNKIEDAHRPVQLVTKN